MRKTALLIALFGGCVMANAAQFPANVQLAIAINNTDVEVGTDKSTTSFPSSGMHTTPTLQVGTDEPVVNPNAPWTKPGHTPGSVWPTAPEYKPVSPPVNSSTTRQ